MQHGETREGDARRGPRANAKPEEGEGKGEGEGRGVSERGEHNKGDNAHHRA